MPSNLFSPSLLGLALHVPPGCSPPDECALQVLSAAGVSAIIDEASKHAGMSNTVDAGMDGLFHWLRGDAMDFASLIATASNLPADGDAFVASLPSGSARSQDVIHTASVRAWQLRTMGCRAIVLPWCELQSAAAESGGWDGIVVQLARYRRPVSAIDYPPSIFMIGEDEAATSPEFE